MGISTDRLGETVDKWWKSRELFRFVLAIVIIVGFLAILGLAMVGRFADVPTLAGIFSGWIVAIVAFYFMEQASDRAAQIVSDETGKKLDILQNQSEDNIERLGAKLADIAKQADFWKNKAMAFRSLLIDVDPTLKGDDEGPQE